MPLQDVKVIIDIKKPASMIGLGKPLILAEKTGAELTYKNYAEIEAVEVDFEKSTNAYKKAFAVFAQGDYRPDELAIITYDPAQTDAGEAMEEDWDED